MGLWQVLLFFLSKYDSDNTARYHKAVAETILNFYSPAFLMSEDEDEGRGRERLPSWLVSFFMVCISFTHQIDIQGGRPSPLTTPTAKEGKWKGDKEGLLRLYLAYNELEAAIAMLPSLFNEDNYLPCHLFDQLSLQIDKLQDPALKDELKRNFNNNLKH